MENSEINSCLEEYKKLTETNKAEIIAYVTSLLSEPKPFLIAQEEAV